MIISPFLQTARGLLKSFLLTNAKSEAEKYHIK